MSHETIAVDVAIIGAGTAGMVARQQAKTHGAGRVLLIEGGVYGTTCARVGCMPSKLLIAAADAAAAVRAAAGFGVNTSEPTIDGPAVMRRVRDHRDRFVASVLRSIERIDDDERLVGWARFVARDRLLVTRPEGGEVEVEATAIVVATGSTPWIPPSLQGLAEGLVVTSDTIFELPDLPRSIAVIGTGVIGLELGQALTRLGVTTTILDVGARMPVVRCESMQTLARELLSERLDLQLSVRELEAEALDSAEGADPRVRLRWRDPAGEIHTLEVDKVLAATGRRPQLERLELGNAGVELDDRGAPTRWDERTGQLADTPIFMAGDVTGERPLLHEAAAEGRIAGINAARFPEVRAHPRYVPLGIMFTDPNVAVVGDIPGLEGEGDQWEVGEVDYAEQGRAIVIGQAYGRARIYAQRDCGVLLGAELIGPGVEHMAHLLAWAIQQRITVPAALAMPYYHPVVEEGLRTALQELGRKLKMAPQPRPLDCGPGV
jgi:dihydrolipoamide dehydrogenase